MSLIDYVLGREVGRNSFQQVKQQLLLKHCREFSLYNNIDFEMSHSSAVNCLDVDITGRYILSGAKNGAILVHDLYNFNGHTSYRCKTVSTIGAEHSGSIPNKSIETVQWYPFDTGLFTTSGMDHMLRLWDTNGMCTFEKFEFNSKIYHHHISPVKSGTTPLIAVATSSNHVYLADMRSGQKTHELRGHKGSVMTCAWSPVRSYYLASGSSDSSIYLWDIRSARGHLGVLDLNNTSQPNMRQKPLQAHNGFVNGVTFTPDGNFLMSVGTDNTIHCWDFYQQKHKEIVYGNVRIRLNKSLKFDVFGYGKFNVCIIPSDNKIVIYEVETGKRLNKLTGHYHFVNACLLQRDRLELYSAGEDQNILFWTPFKEPESEDPEREKKIKFKEDNWSDDEG
ncbi:DNA excision repair protein ERCC-8-like [Homalodisca vitripennis]|uniref:DNA excision repair protein ERCC-8-like n=1 Tax=Homalodisca vitripennis TaxID=197043 RepID=UPI001EE9CEDE|nr:DNA excision repair protein ERCC-8-like [Homalodisca vitripennis]